MSCPTCDHTMQTLYKDKTLTRWWCPRCGTLKNRLVSSEGVVDEAADTPALVERCRRFEEKLSARENGLVSSEWAAEWMKLGIAESINTPDRRPLCIGLSPPEENSSTSPTPAKSESTPPTH